MFAREALSSDAVHDGFHILLVDSGANFATAVNGNAQACTVVRVMPVGLVEVHFVFVRVIFMLHAVLEPLDLKCVGHPPVRGRRDYNVASQFLLRDVLQDIIRHGASENNQHGHLPCPHIAREASGVRAPLVRLLGIHV